MASFKAMEAEPYDIVIDRSGTFTLNYTWTDDLGNPIDITGFTATMQIRTHRKAPTALFTLTSSPAAGITLGDAAGTVAVRIEQVDTATIDADAAVYEIVLDDGTTETPHLRGAVTIVGGINQ